VQFSDPGIPVSLAWTCEFPQIADPPDLERATSRSLFKVYFLLGGTRSEIPAMRPIEKVASAGMRQIEQLSWAVIQSLERCATRGSITPLVIATLIVYVFIVFRPRA
jgi:hypothetical protein